MLMKIDWRTFRSDKNFFLKYFFMQMVTSLLLMCGLVLLRDVSSMQLTWQPELFYLLPLAFVLGIQLPALLHNAVHFNIKPKWLNEIIGELGGFFVLFGLGPFRISHFLHHAFSDSDRDPHPPLGLKFFPFLVQTQLNTIQVIREEFLNRHRRDWISHAILFTEMSFYYVSLLARVGVWIFALGPNLFVYFYLPAYITNVLVFAHINYATHETQPDGSVVIVNLNRTWYHKLVNVIGSGVYFHKNHHERPHLYNPMRSA
jgi:fatty acid desaturase